MKSIRLFSLLSILFVSSLCFGQVRTGGEMRDFGSSDEQAGESESLLGNKGFKPKLSLGIGVGFSNLFGDFNQSNPVPAARIGLGTRLTPSLLVGVEAYVGQLSSRLSPISWAPQGFSETSIFQAMDIDAKVSLGNFVQGSSNLFLKLLGNVFIGSGYGFIYNSNTDFSGQFSEKSKLKVADRFKKSDFSTYIPLNIGIRVPMKSFLGMPNAKFMINYQINYTFTDYLDSYSPPPVSANNKFNDCYTVITAGFSFYLTKD